MRDVVIRINVAKALLANGNMGRKSVLRVNMTNSNMVF